MNSYLKLSRSSLMASHRVLRVQLNTLLLHCLLHALREQMPTHRRPDYTLFQHVAVMYRRNCMHMHSRVIPTDKL